MVYMIMYFHITNDKLIKYFLIFNYLFKNINTSLIIYIYLYHSYFAYYFGFIIIFYFLIFINLLINLLAKPIFLLSIVFENAFVV